MAPPPGLYRNGKDLYRIHRSKRGHWYAQVEEPDGSWEYVAQNIDTATLTPVSERQPSGHCSEVGCSLPQWHRGLCGMHLAADAVRYARSIKVVAA
ncbi:MAG: hypothetical protein ACLPLP_23915 [Mycobacterium sp.]